MLALAYCQQEATGAFEHDGARPSSIASCRLLGQQQPGTNVGALLLRTCLYVHRPIMCSGGVVIGVSPAMRPRGRCTAEHNRQLREDHRGRQRCEMQARPAGYCQAISQPVFGADALGFHEPVARIAVGGRPSPIDPRWPGYRRIDASPACSASRRLCAAVSAPKDALSRGNEFRSEPVVHNRTLNIEAGVGPVVVSDVLIAKGAHVGAVDGGLRGPALVSSVWRCLCLLDSG